MKKQIVFVLSGAVLLLLNLGVIALLLDRGVSKTRAAEKSPAPAESRTVDAIRPVNPIVGNDSPIVIPTDIFRARFLNFLDDETVAIWSQDHFNWAIVTVGGVLSYAISDAPPVAIWAEGSGISILSESERGLVLQEGDKVLHAIPPFPRATSFTYNPKTDVGFANAIFGTELVTFSMRSETTEYVRPHLETFGIDTSPDGRYILGSSGNSQPNATGDFNGTVSTKLIDLFLDREIEFAHEESDVDQKEYVFMNSRFSSQGNLALVSGYKFYRGKGSPPLELLPIRAFSLKGEEVFSLMPSALVRYFSYDEVHDLLAVSQIDKVLLYGDRGGCLLLEYAFTEWERVVEVEINQAGTMAAAVALSGKVYFFQLPEKGNFSHETE